MRERDNGERRRVGTAVVAELDNGLRVVVHEDYRSPVAVCNAWVRVGSNLETDAVRGWAHGIEHMLFKGTARRAENDFAMEVAEIGGTTNAGTGYETTNYHITVPAENLSRAVDILADALLHASFEPDALDSERQVLVHENHMYDDMPSGFGVTWRWALETAFDRSPYRHHIGGPDSSLLETPREAILDFYRSAYDPANMTVVVAGAVSADDVLPLIERKFATEGRPRSAPLPQPPVEPPHEALRYRIENGDIQRAYGKIVFPGPAAGSPDRAVLAVIRQVLADGRSCRLHRRVQQEMELVNAITLLDESGPREGIMMVDFECDPAKAAAVVDAVATILQEMRDEPPTVAELTKAKIRAERAHLFALETVQGQAATLGWHDAMGDIATAFTIPQRIAAVTGDDVRRVCNDIFRRSNASVLIYLPRDERPADIGLPGTAAEMDERLAGMLADRPARPVETKASPVEISVAAAAARGSALKSEIPFVDVPLNGGGRLFCRSDSSQPLICLGAHVAGGVWLEPAGLEGLSALTLSVQAKAAVGETPAALQEIVEGHGASLSPFAASDHSGLYLTGLTRHLPLLMRRLSRLCGVPAFAPEEIEKERRFALEDLASLADDTFQFAARALREAVYAGHPYGHPLMGTEASLPRIVPADLTDHHRRIWTPPNVTIVASGDVTAEILAPLCEELLDGLPRGSAPELPAAPDLVRPQAPVFRRLERDVSQSVVLAAWIGPEGPNEDRAELSLLRALLNGQSGRLFEQLRNRRSLCYSSGVQTSAGFGTGMTVAFVMTDPGQEQQAREALAAELAATAETAAPDVEFERARARLIGNLLISRQSAASRVGACARDVLYGRGPNDFDRLLEQLRQTTPAAVRDAAARIFDRPGRYEIVVGPPLDRERPL